MVFRRRLLVSAALVGPALTLLVGGCRPQTEPSPAPCVDATALARGTPNEDADFDPVVAADLAAQGALELFDVPGMSVAVVVDDEVVLAKGYGQIERGQEQAIDAETSFAIASNTKAFTATAVGLLVADGVIGWDDRVIDHLPELVLWNDYVTGELRVRDLLSHRVGLSTWAGDLMWLSSNYDRETVMSRMRHLPADYGFRERYGYCNLMFMVAGELIERKSGSTWDAFVRERILEPLDMKGVSTRVGELDGKTNVAKPHILVDGEWETTPYLDLAAVGPAASFHASALELTHWLRMQMANGSFEGKQVVPAKVIRETRQPHIWLTLGEEDFLDPRRHLLAYGLGWYVADYRGELLVTHGGGMPGMTSRVIMFPESKVGVVVLTSSESAVSNALALKIADLFLTESSAPRKDYVQAAFERVEEAKERGDEEAPELEGSPPKELAGKWKNPILGAGKVSSSDGATWFEVPEHGGLRCRLYGATASDDAGLARELPCKWEDPNMGVSVFRLQRRGKRIRSMSFKVRPDFYDPLEYTYTR